MSPCTLFEEPFYVGKGNGRRAKLHGCASSRSPAKSRIEEIASTGDRVTVMILADQLTEDDAFALERYFIAQFGRASHKEGPLLNRTAGGQGMSGFPVPQSTRDAVSRAHKGKRRPPEFGAKVSAAKKGVPNLVARGVPRSEDVRRRISESQKGKPRPHLIGRSVSAETRAKIAAGHAGKTLSKEIRDKISAAKKGQEAPNKGKPMPPQVLEAIRAGHRRWADENAAARPPQPSLEARAARRAENQFKPGHNKGVPMPESVRKKLRGLERSPDQCARISAGKRGKPNNKLRGRARPPEVIEKIKATKALRRANG